VYHEEPHPRLDRPVGSISVRRTRAQTTRTTLPSIFCLQRAPVELTAQVNHHKPYEEAIRLGMDVKQFGKIAFSVPKYTAEMMKIQKFTSLTEPARSSAGGVPTPIEWMRAPEDLPLFSSFTEDHIFRENSLKASRVLRRNAQSPKRKRDIPSISATMIRRTTSGGSYQSAARWSHYDALQKTLKNEGKLNIPMAGSKYLLTQTRSSPDDQSTSLSSPVQPLRLQLADLRTSHSLQKIRTRGV
jgi:hypothetical protein